ncbi:extracellular solute-binding protein [Stackebrandtia soli]|uniref:extracellular solute-binding protein n=1 Tax=Stackebrandtia soli TaxID=1892856 RepID=UPI0039ECD9A6
MLLLATATATGCTAILGEGDTLVTASTTTGANWGDVRTAFTESTGITVPSEDNAANATIDRLEAEGDATTVDTAYLEPLHAFRAHSDGLIAPFDGDRLADVPVELRSPDKTWFTVHTAAVAIIVNTEVLGDTKLPKGWKDLTKKRYRDMVSFLDPVSVSAGYATLTAVNGALGGDPDDWEPATDWAEDLLGNGASLLTTSDPSAVLSGDVPILIDTDATGYRLAAASDDITVILPKEGTIAMPYMLGKLENAPHPDNADAFLSFALSRDAQRLFAKSYFRPVTDIAIPAEIAKVMAPEAEYLERVAVPDVSEMDMSYIDAVVAWNSHVLG